MARKTSPPIDTADLIEPIAAAEILGVTVTRVRQLVKAGRIVPALRLPRGGRLYRRRDIERFAAERASGTAA